MKLIVRAADYGMCDSITDGCIKAIRDGILTDVGMMTNNRSAQRAAEQIRMFPNVSIGQDLNVVSGTSLSKPASIPSLINEKGDFLSSMERKQSGNYTIVYHELIMEMEAQVERFIRLFNKKPVYLAGHSISTPEVDAAIQYIADKYDIANDCFAIPSLTVAKRWYYQNLVIGDDRKPTYSLDLQAQTDVKKFILDDQCEIIGHPYVLLPTHCGYCDGELMEMSSFSVIRGRELEALCAPEIKQWIITHNIELIDFEQFLKERDI